MPCADVGHVPTYQVQDNLLVRPMPAMLGSCCAGVQILCSRMKVLAMPSVNAALPRGWDGASPEQIKEAFVPNVQRGCWERRPEQQHFLQRVR